MRAVYYSLVLTNESEVYENQWIRSIRSLRKFNSTIPVHLFLFNNPAQTFLQKAEQYGVIVHSLGSYREHLRELAGNAGEVLSCVPTLNKLLPLGYFSSDVPRLLFLDCDTFFFGDVDSLFERYQKCHWYAREEAHSKKNVLLGYRPTDTDEDVLHRIAAQTGAAPIPPYNSGVVLLNHGIAAELFDLRREFVRYAWRLSLGACNSEALDLPEDLRNALASVNSGGFGGALEYPSGSFWILEQVALWLTLGRIPGLTHEPFSMSDVIQNGEFMLFRSYRTKCTVVHYFGGNEALFLQDAKV